MEEAKCKAEAAIKKEVKLEERAEAKVAKDVKMVKAKAKAGTQGIIKVAVKPTWGG